MSKRPVVFISYSWDNEEHKEWVLNLANKLIELYDIDVLLDQYEISLGKNLLYFMEKSIESADKVLLIMTPAYRVKANSREKGVGYESSIISKELYESSINNKKFYPVLRGENRHESIPNYLNSLVFHDMRDDVFFNSQLFKLNREIRGIPQIVKPTFIGLPESVQVDPIIEQANKYKKEKDFENKREVYLNSPQSNEDANQEFNKLIDLLDEKAKFYTKNTPLYFYVKERKRFETVEYRNNLDEDFPYGNLVGENEIATLFSLNAKSKIIHIFKWKFEKMEQYNIEHVLKSSSCNTYYTLDVDDDLNPVWRSEGDDFLTNEEIASDHFAELMERITEKDL